MSILQNETQKMCGVRGHWSQIFTQGKEEQQEGKKALGKVPRYCMMTRKKH